MKNKNKKIILGMFLAMGMSHSVTTPKVTPEERMVEDKTLPSPFFQSVQSLLDSISARGDTKDAAYLDKVIKGIDLGKQDKALMCLLLDFALCNEFQNPQKILDLKEDYTSGTQTVTTWYTPGEPSSYKWQFATVTESGEVKPRHVYLEKVAGAGLVITEDDSGHSSEGGIVKAGNGLFYVGKARLNTAAPTDDFLIITPAILITVGDVGNIRPDPSRAPIIINPKGEVVQSSFNI